MCQLFNYFTVTIRYPALCKIDDAVITYTKYIYPHVFQGTLRGVNVIIKFTETYGFDVHNHLYDFEFAPKLHHYQDFGRFKAVVMDFVHGVRIDEYMNDTNQDSIRQQCNEI